MNPSQGQSLAVILTRGMSLRGWHAAGILERELALYRRLADTVQRIDIISYGGKDEQRYVEPGGPITVHTNRWRLPSNLYAILAPILHMRVLHRASALKTNQLNGAWCGAIAHYLMRRPLIVRCGYVWSQQMERLGEPIWKCRLARHLEGWSLRAADRVLVTTQAAADELIRRHGLARSSLRIVPNFVDTDLFTPQALAEPEPGLVGFVGRFEPQKNLFAQIEAVSGIPGAKLLLVGDGSQREALISFARARGLAVEWPGTVPHEELPSLLRRMQVFALTSDYEGHPKAAIEAMACGVAVVGTRVAGIRDVIAHDETGYLCANSIGAIREAIGTVLNDEALRQRLSRSASAFARRHYALSTVASQEKQVLEEVLHSSTHEGVVS